MFGFELIAVPFLTTQIAFSNCTVRAQPRIATRTIISPTKFNHTKSHKNLENFNIDTISPYSKNVHAKVSGLMSSNINVSMTANVAWSNHPSRKTSCMWYDSIQINISSAPTIYIASEHKKNGCRYRSTLEHEQKHVKADEAILAKYKPIFENAVRQAMERTNTRVSFNTAQAKTRQKQMNTIVQNALKGTLEKMKFERRTVQQSIDSLTEYEALSHACLGFR